MFKKWADNVDGTNTNNYVENLTENVSIQKTNTILKGSKLIGDINVTCDLELSGEIEGNITSEQDSNIVIKGTCRGNIETREGNVDIEGELQSGNIVAGSDVKILGKFNGGQVKANGKVYINGEFNGKLEGNEIELGSNALGKGELYYKEFISISKGAKVDVQISQVPQELKLVKTPPETEAVDIEPPAKKIRRTK